LRPIGELATFFSSLLLAFSTFCRQGCRVECCPPEVYNLEGVNKSISSAILHYQLALKEVSLMSAGESPVGVKEEQAAPVISKCMDCGDLLGEEFVPIYDWYCQDGGDPPEIGRLCLDCYNSACSHCHGMGCLGECAYD
jgi:hypothetical protein